MVSRKIKQKGSVLAISLVMLTAITLVSAMSMQRSTLQTRITANIQHKETVFASAMDEQEFWYRRFKTAGRNDPILTTAADSFVIDPLGVRVYAPAALADSGNIPNFLQVNNSVTYLSATPGENALAEGEEPNNRINNHMELRSVITMVNRTFTSDQRTGMTYPSLNTGQNSMY